MQIGIDASPAVRVLHTGTERYTLEIIRHLLTLPQAADHLWRLYLPSAAELDAFLSPSASEALRARVEVRLLPAARMWSHRRLAQELFASPPDVFFVPGHVMPLALWPRRLPPTVMTMHDVAFRRYPDTYAPRQRVYLDAGYGYGCRQATRVVAVSRATAQDLQRFYGLDAARLRVIHEAPAPVFPVSDAQRRAVRDHYALQRPYALFLGTIQPRKNLPRVIQALAQLRAQGFDDLDFVVAGAPGWLADETLREPKRVGMENRVHFIGYVDEIERAALLSGARFFCYPSLIEGFGLPILEAQSAGTPVLTANNSSLPEVAGDAALLVDPLDVDALADAMLRLSRDEALRQQLIAAGFHNVQRFSWENAARETFAVLEEAAAERNTPP